MIDIKCPQCGTKHSPSATYCPSCGVPLSPVEGAKDEAAPREAGTDEWHLETPKDKKGKKRAAVVGIAFILVMFVVGGLVGYWQVTSRRNHARNEARQKNEAVNKAIQDIQQQQMMNNGMTDDKAEVEKAAMDYAQTSTEIPFSHTLALDGTSFTSGDMADVYIKDTTDGKRYRVSLMRTSSGAGWVATSVWESG